MWRSAAAHRNCVANPVAASLPSSLWRGARAPGTASPCWLRQLGPDIPTARARATRARYTQPLSTPSAHHAPAAEWAGGRLGGVLRSCTECTSRAANKGHAPGALGTPPLIRRWLGRLSFSQLDLLALCQQATRVLRTRHVVRAAVGLRVALPILPCPCCPAHVAPQRLLCSQPSVQRQSLCARDIRTKVGMLPNMGPPVCGRGHLTSTRARHGSIRDRTRVIVTHSLRRVSA